MSGYNNLRAIALQICNYYKQQLHFTATHILWPVVVGRIITISRERMSRRVPREFGWNFGVIISYCSYNMITLRTGIVRNSITPPPPTSASARIYIRHIVFGRVRADDDDKYFHVWRTPRRLARPILAENIMILLRCG